MRSFSGQQGSHRGQVGSVQRPDEAPEDLGLIRSEFQRRAHLLRHEFRGVLGRVVASLHASDQALPAELVAEQMRAALELGSDRAEVLRRFVRSLDGADAAAVRALLARE